MNSSSYAVVSGSAGIGMGQMNKPIAVQDSLTVMVNQSLNDMQCLESRVDSLIARLSSSPQCPEPTKAERPIWGAIEAASEIRNVGRRLQDKMTHLDNIL